MMYRKEKVVVSLVLAALILMAGSAWAQSLKERMRSRLPVIVDLKTRGVVGENNQGFLEMLKGKTEKADVVAAENKDRSDVYAAIAKKSSTSAQVVGQRRAIQIADKANPGEWLQDNKGKWYQKK